MSTREYAKNLFSKWSDEDWLNQPRFDKLFWECLNGSRAVNLIGVFPLNFTRWRKAMRDGPQIATEIEVKAALIRLQRRRALFIDENTGEGLIRTRIRNDDLDKQPNPLLSALRTMAVLDSPVFAVVLLGELDRIQMPVIDKTTPAATRLRDNLKRAWEDARENLERLAEGITEPLPEPFGEDFPEGLPRPAETETPPNPSQNPSVSVSGSVSVSSSRSVVGHLGGSRAHTREAAEPTPTAPEAEPDHATATAPVQAVVGTSTEDDPEPPQRCKAHRDNPTAAIDDNCGPCANFRKAHARWQVRDRRRHAQATSTAAHTTAALKAQAIHACNLCDPDGYRHGTTTVCDHHDRTDTIARGRAAVTAALAAKETRTHA